MLIYQRTILHARAIHACLRQPGPPNLGLSKQFLQLPQSLRLQLSHEPQRTERSRFTLWFDIAMFVGSVASTPSKELGDSMCMGAASGLSVGESVCSAMHPSTAVQNSMSSSPMDDLHAVAATSVGSAAFSGVDGLSAMPLGRMQRR
eukprot:CAMPEP_0119338662 /NCGR_PEP_ID=MMETSP1333-20130426/96614_1 /TAXON_ID=418940 /ORGANISM="Scyphosphaera apsteinii, Strain RCC1455" /LENGTH=146 /DNA_ID=CAMNT_0007350005 /DNA_START=366 /DNA_END=807 /DNA_ORIENTATION=+